FSSLLTVDASNSVFWDAGEQVASQGVVNIRFSDVRGGFDGEGNLNADPLFRDPSNGDYHLSAGSPCIDAGDPTYAAGLGETDIDCQTRVWNGRIDMGADEAGSFTFSDLNCDGSINQFDIQAFVVALSQPGDYAGQYPACDINLADTNHD